MKKKLKEMMTPEIYDVITQAYARLNKSLAQMTNKDLKTIGYPL